jgi:hypothetical protein
MLCLALMALAAGCTRPDKFTVMKSDYRGRVELASWPALAKGVAGYNLYLAPKADGPWERINDQPITGGHMMVPYLEPGVEYCFRLTSVSSAGVESRPGGVFKRKATAAP